MKPSRNTFPLLLLITAAALAQTNPVPLINNPLVPDAAAPGGASFTLTVNGTGFVPSSVVNWNGSALATTFVSNSKLTATVPAGNIATASTASVAVINPASGGGKSNVDFFEIRQPFTAVSFGASTVGTGDVSESVTAADLNNDGNLDLITVDGSSGVISSLLGNGNGTFQLVGEYGEGFNFFLGVTTGDFNGDGKLDLAVGSIGVVAIFLGNGDGTFQPEEDIPIAGVAGYVLLTADFNGDGKLDLAVANEGTSDVLILLGNGDGTFQTAVAYFAGNYLIYGLVTGDFNRDGRLDLAATAKIDSAVAVLLGNGDGTFQNPQEYATASGPYSLAVGDVNGDGILDLVTECYLAARFSVLLGNGDGTFQGHLDNPALEADTLLALGDLNGDGKLDVIIPGGRHGTVATFLGNGDGTFQHSNFFPALNGVVVPGVGDFNNDGLLDLVGVNDTTNLNYMPGTPSVVSQTNLIFGKVTVGKSESRTVTLTNIGNAAFAINAIAVKGTNASVFAQKNNCGKSLAAGASCTITITFRPQKAGSYSATVSVSDSAVSPAQTLYLTGAGT
jgi:hypothetical protein